MLSKDYQHKLFCGRSTEKETLVETLMNPGAHQERMRAPMIEGGAGVGKTWLLRDVEYELQKRPAVTLFIASDFAHVRGVLPTSMTPKQMQQRLLFDLWQNGIKRVQVLAPPSLSPADTPEEKREKIEKYVQEDPVNLFRDFTDHLLVANPPHVLVLIVDGIDEFEQSILRILEDHFVVPLFAYPCVRLLSSRRVRSSTHRWTRFVIKQQLPSEPSMVEPFDEPEVQVGNLLQDTAYTFVQIRKFTRYYSWQNPGANDFLVERFKENGGTLTRADFLDCLKELMRSVRTGGLTINDTYFGYLGRLIESPLDMSSPGGVARYQVKSVLDEIANSDLNTFLAHLQERGIGYPPTSSTFRIHAHIAELFKEIE